MIFNTNPILDQRLKIKMANKKKQATCYKDIMKKITVENFEKSTITINFYHIMTSFFSDDLPYFFDDYTRRKIKKIMQDAINSACP